jgi:hypothetical protein
MFSLTNGKVTHPYFRATEEFLILFKATKEFHGDVDLFICESTVLLPVIGSHGLSAVVKPSIQSFT